MPTSGSQSGIVFKPGDTGGESSNPARLVLFQMIIFPICLLLFTFQSLPIVAFWNESKFYSCIQWQKHIGVSLLSCLDPWKINFFILIFCFSGHFPFSIRGVLDDKAIYLCLYMAPLAVLSLSNHMRWPAEKAGIPRELGSIPLRQGSAIFFNIKKDQIVRILGFVNHMNSISTTQLFQYSFFCKNRW